MRPLSEKLALLAFKELNETPERIQQDLIILKVWIKQQKHLEARTSNEFLIAFLRRCCYSLEETKRRIDRFFTFYNIAPEILSNRIITQRVLDINRLGVHYYPEFPKCDNQCALVINALGRYDMTKYQIREILHFTAIAMEVMALESDNASVAGICLVVDLAGMTFDRMNKFDKILFRKWGDWIQDCCPLRYREIYIINASKEIHVTLQIVRGFLIPSRDTTVRLLKTVDELYKFIPKKCLPEEYGGCNGHMAECIAYMEDLLKSYRKYFDEDFKYGTREELRESEPLTCETECGINGSFRKLNID